MHEWVGIDSEKKAATIAGDVDLAPLWVASHYRVKGTKFTVRCWIGIGEEKFRDVAIRGAFLADGFLRCLARTFGVLPPIRIRTNGPWLEAEVDLAVCNRGSGGDDLRLMFNIEMDIRSLLADTSWMPAEMRWALSLRELDVKVLARRAAERAWEALLDLNPGYWKTLENVLVETAEAMMAGAAE